MLRFFLFIEVMTYYKYRIYRAKRFRDNSDNHGKIIRSQYFGFTAGKKYLVGDIEGGDKRCFLYDVIDIKTSKDIESLGRDAIGIVLLSVHEDSEGALETGLLKNPINSLVGILN